tara:strand:+ start:880 stop:1065 length:186 start_codon:yes stop_codon:yes gene_type:complete
MDKIETVLKTENKTYIEVLNQITGERSIRVVTETTKWFPEPSGDSVPPSHNPVKTTSVEIL